MKVARAISAAIATHAADPNAHHVPVSVNIGETEVFYEAAPTTWTDLDLSAVVGAKACLVMLKIKSGSTGNKYAVRRNGDTDEAYGTNGQGCALIDDSTQNVHHVFLVLTDAAGIIEWMSSAATAATVDVMAFVG